MGGVKPTEYLTVFVSRVWRSRQLAFAQTVNTQLRERGAVRPRPGNVHMFSRATFLALES